MGRCWNDARPDNLLPDSAGATEPAPLPGRSTCLPIGNLGTKPLEPASSFVPGWESETPRQPRIEDQVLAILSDGAGTLAFNGLRRALKIHPESLIRALRRLERSGAILRSENGYTLREPLPTRTSDLPRPRTLAALRLPSPTSGADLLGRLAGRWIGPLRWLGVYEHPGDPWLVWTVGAGPRHVMLSTRRGSLRLLTDAETPDRAVDDAAFALLSKALDSLQGAPDSNPDRSLALRAESEAVGVPN